MTRTDAIHSQPLFLVNPSTAAVGYGKQVDWTTVTAVSGKKWLKPGTVVALTAGGKLMPRSAATTETAYGILVTYAEENNLDHASTGYGVVESGSIAENLLPEASGTPRVINSTWKTELIATGGGWRFQQHSALTL